MGFLFSSNSESLKSESSKSESSKSESSKPSILFGDENGTIKDIINKGNIIMKISMFQVLKM